MKKITVEEYKTRTPVRNKEYFESLSSEEQENYIELYNVYAALLTKHFIEKYKLDEYDKVLINSPFSFPKVKEEDMDIYQYLASDDLSFIYLRNNLYIERLSQEEKNKLVWLAQEEKPEYTPEVEELMENTFRKVIVENETEEENLNIFYGPMTGAFLAPDNAIIIGIRYDDYQLLPGESEEDWLEANNNRLQDTETVISILETRMPMLTNTKTAAIKYNEFSIKKKEVTNTSENTKNIPF